MDGEGLGALAGTFVGTKVQKGVQMVIQESGVPVETALGLVDALHKAQTGEIGVDTLQEFLGKVSMITKMNKANVRVADNNESQGGPMPGFSRGVPGGMAGLGGANGIPPSMAGEQSLSPEEEAQRRALEENITRQMQAAPGAGTPLGRVAGPGVPGGQMQVDLNDPRVQAALRQHAARMGMGGAAPAGGPAMPMAPQGMRPPQAAPAPRVNPLNALTENLNVVGQDLADALYKSVLQGVDGSTVCMGITLTIEGWTVVVYLLNEQTGQWEISRQFPMPGEHGMLGRQVRKALQHINDLVDDVEE